LPYPSYLPGNKLYRISEIIDGAKRYWYFGTLTQLKYAREMADKRIVEAKTLFEYKQYALGVRALKKSNIFISEIPLLLLCLTNEKKNNPEIIRKIEEQMNSHLDVLARMFSEVPDRIEWTEEKQTPREIHFSKLYEEAVAVRAKTVLQ
jgi:hypothetical protein